MVSNKSIFSIDKDFVAKSVVQNWKKPRKISKSALTLW